MPQINFAISFMLGNASKENFHKVYIRVNGDGKDFRIPTIIKIKKDEWNGKEVIKNVLKDDINTYLQNESIKIQRILIDAAITEQAITLELLTGKAGKNLRLKNFIESFLATIHVTGTKKTLKSIYKKLPDISMADIPEDFLHDFEMSLRSNAHNNTINTQTKKVKQLLLSAIKQGHITNKNTIKAIQDYTPPKYIQEIPEYLEISEIEMFSEMCIRLKPYDKKTCGYYFLLSCYTGWRLGDLMQFDYEYRVKGGKVMLRAGKNKKIVSIPIYPALKEVLEYCKYNREKYYSF